MFIYMYISVQVIRRLVEQQHVGVHQGDQQHHHAGPSHGGETNEKTGQSLKTTNKTTPLDRISQTKRETRKRPKWMKRPS